MKTRIAWKMIATLLLGAWAWTELTPVTNQPLPQFLENKCDSSKLEDLQHLLETSHNLQTEDKGMSFVGSLQQTLLTEKTDLSQFFPQFDVSDVKNLQKRNDILLQHIVQLSQGRLKLGLDLQGGMAFTLKIDEQALDTDNEDLAKTRLEKAVEIMHSRVNGLGVSEPIIRISGKDSIEIQLPGITTSENPDALSALQKPAKLTFHKVHRTLTPDNNPSGKTPPGYILLEEDDTNPKTGEILTKSIYAKRIPDLLGDSVDNAYASIAEDGGFQINLSFNSIGAERFKALTGSIAEENAKSSSLPENHPGRYGRLAIVLDGKLYSAPRVTEAIAGGHARISGNFTQREAIELANVLNNPLEFALTVDEMYEVGPSLAEDARSASINASILGVALVAFFMIAYYRLAGVIAMIAVTFNIILTLAAMAMLGATLTLPGVAALVLNMGMAVDAHILIFERMREELRLGKSMKVALFSGHEKAFATILDSNLTTLLASGILIFLGTGPVKGFGVSLSLGILATLFTALITSYGLLDIFVEKGWLNRMVSVQAFANAKFNFLKSGRACIIGMTALILAGAAIVGVRGKDLMGIDFRGGESITLAFSEKLSLNSIYDTAAKAGIDYIAPTYQKTVGSNEEKLAIQTETGNGQALVAALQTAHPEANLELIGESFIGASVSDAIQINAIISIILALLGILVYVAFRFEVGYGIGAALSTTMDALLAIGIFAAVGGQFSAPMVAAVLMIIGYSINDKIVVFDRIREELKLNPFLSLLEIVNLSINRTLSRTTLTSLTTFLAALALYVFGSGEICDFAFLFMLGIVIGTFSSIFIASPLFFGWHKGDRRHVESKEAAPSYDWNDPESRADV